MTDPENPNSGLPVELRVLQSLVGVWDAEVTVWPEGLNAEALKFTGVETNRPYGDYWVSSDFDSEFGGHVNRVHSIVGYDLDERKLSGLVIDHGPYAATMEGDYDLETRTVNWVTRAKSPEGEPIIQQTTDTQKTANERLLVLSVADEENPDRFVKFMEIQFVRRED